MPNGEQPKTQYWMPSALDGTGYNIKARLDRYQKAGQLSEMSCQMILHALGEGHEMDVYGHPLTGKPMVEMNGVVYTGKEFNDLLALAQIGGGEQAGVN